VGLLNSADAWAMCGLIILLACLGKFGGSAVAARLTGLRWREASAVGVLMNTRGLMELIVLNIGLDLGVISPTLFTMMVVMALVTTFITSPLLNWIYPAAELARDKVELSPVPAGPAPFTVLMCVSHGQAGPGMAALGRALTGGSPAGGAHLYALHLISAERTGIHRLHEPRPPEEGALAPLLSSAKHLELPVRSLSFVSSEPSADICRTAEAKRADLVLLGWHKPLFSRTMLGGTVNEVMREATTGVAVLVDRGLSETKRVLVPFIGSQNDRQALSLARRILRHTGAEVTVLHVTAPGSATRGTSGRALVEELFPQELGQVRFKAVEHESPEEAALAEASQGYDLTVVGAGAEWGLEDRFFGLSRERIIREAPGSLLIVRHPQTSSAPAVASAAMGGLSTHEGIS
jgi:nucleotide-binding universal stress UspA family protein